MSLRDYSLPRVALLIGVLVLGGAVFIALQIRPAPSTLPPQAAVSVSTATSPVPLKPWDGIAFVDGERILVPDQWLTPKALAWREQACQSSSWPDGDNRYDQISFPEDLRDQMKIPKNKGIWLYTPEGMWPVTLDSPRVQPDGFADQGCIGTFMPLLFHTSAHQWSTGVIAFQNKGKIYKNLSRTSYLTHTGTYRVPDEDWPTPVTEWIQQTIETAWSQASPTALAGPDGNPPPQIVFTVNGVSVEQGDLKGVYSVVWSKTFWPPTYEAVWGVWRAGQSVVETTPIPEGIPAEHIKAAFDLDRDGRLEILTKSNLPFEGQSLPTRHLLEWDGHTFQPFSNQALNPS